jgi:hypothetical protein
MIRTILTGTLFSLGLALFAAANPGCGGGSDCESACEKTKSAKCPNAPSDCSKECSDQDKLGADSGCTKEIDALFTCMAGAKNICTAPTDECRKEGNAYAACVTPFCDKSANAAECAATSKD